MNRTPRHLYRLDTEHMQLGEYGGECRLSITLVCLRCVERGQGRSLLELSQWFGTTVAEVEQVMEEHESEHHLGERLFAIWLDIGGGLEPHSYFGAQRWPSAAEARSAFDAWAERNRQIGHCPPQAEVHEECPAHPGEIRSECAEEWS